MDRSLGKCKKQEMDLQWYPWYPRNIWKVWESMMEKKRDKFLLVLVASTKIANVSEVFTDRSRFLHQYLLTILK